MTDVQRCDGCGDVSLYQHNEYEFSDRVTDPDAGPDAVDIIPSGHLCTDCAREVAELIDDLGDD